MSWLNNTGADNTVSPLLAEITRLQRELDRANESIDDKLDKLEDAGLGVVGLTKRLEDARARIVALEEEIARLSRKEERRVHRLERARCQKCLTKVDLRSVIRAEADERCGICIGRLLLGANGFGIRQLCGCIQCQSSLRATNPTDSDN